MPAVEDETRYDRIRALIGLILGPIAAIAVGWAPLPLPTPAHILAAVLAAVVVFWITEPIPIPVTALLGPAVCVAAGLAPPKEVLASFAHPIIFLFIGSFLIARAMSEHHLDRWIALAILSWPVVRRGPGRVLFAYGAITAVLSMWISNTSATAMMLPIGLGLLAALGRTRGPYGTAMMLMASYAASIGGIATLVGTPPNLIAVGFLQEQANVRISFFAWIAFGLPIVTVMFLMLYLLLRFLHPLPSYCSPSACLPDRQARPGAEPVAPPARGERAGWSAEQVATALAFAVAVALWLLPGAAAVLGGADAPAARWLERHLPEGIAAILAASLLFLLPFSWRGRPALTWSQAAGIDWGTILLFGGGLALGDLMFRTGLSEALGTGVTRFWGVGSEWSLTAVAIVLAILLSELTSNTASANMLVPVMISIAHGAGVNPIPAALGACLGASYGFMLPVSTPPNAIVYGSGLITIRQMMRAGVLLDLLGGILIWVGLRLLLPPLGLA